jgi:hypothetical protein
MPTARGRDGRRNDSCSRPPTPTGAHMLKILLWIVVIIFVIGLLVVTGILDLIF